MNQEKAQLFLSIMDTLHDFTGPRIQHIEGGKMIHQVIEDMILRLLRPEVNEIVKHLRDLNSDAYEELIGFLEVMYKERDFYGMGNLIPPENVERSTKHMVMKYILHTKNYKPIYTPKRDMGTGAANNVWTNREHMYRDYHRYTTDVIQINIGDKTEGTGIFATEDVSSQAKSMYDYLCLIYNAQRIVYVPDANSLGKDLVCLNDLGHPTVYKGIFDKYDFGNTGMVGGAPKKKPATNAPTCVQNEFQEYQLHAKDKELLLLPTMRVEFDHMLSTYILKHRDDIDLQFKHKRQGGVPMFLDCLLKMRTFLGSMHYMTPKEKVQLEQELQSESLQIIQGMYRVSLSKEDMKDRDKVRAYLLSLFDLKRAGDYLAVKACTEANRNAPEGTKYVFISNDQLAILYALMQNVPCIQTTLMGRKKDKLFLTIYNIHREVRNPSQAVNMRSDDKTSTKQKARTAVASRMHLMSPNIARPSANGNTSITPAQNVAKDLGRGSFVATTLKKHYDRQMITREEFKDIKSAIIDLSDEEEKQRTHSKLTTLKRNVRKTLRNIPPQEGGMMYEPEELTDIMFIDFANMVRKLKLSFPPYFWIIFRFVFFHIRPVDYFDMGNTNVPSAPSSSSFASDSAKRVSDSMQSKSKQPSKGHVASITPTISMPKNLRSVYTVSKPSKSVYTPSMRLIGKGTND